MIDPLESSGVVPYMDQGSRQIGYLSGIPTKMINTGAAVAPLIHLGGKFL